MTRLAMLAMLAGALALASTGEAKEVRRLGSAQAPIAASTEVPAGSRIVYVSGKVPDAVDPSAPAGSVQRYGDTAAQTRSVIRKIEAQLKPHGMGLGDIVMMRVFLIAPPGQARMDFAGMMSAYRDYFGTAAQPNKPARSTIQIVGLVDPGWLVEIEATAAKPRGGGK